MKRKMESDVSFFLLIGNILIGELTLRNTYRYIP